MCHNIIGTITRLATINTEPIINNFHENLLLFVNRAVICGAARMPPNGAIAPADNFSKKSKFSRIAPMGSFPIFTCDAIVSDGGVGIKIVFQIVAVQLSR